jgi:hypothetical protein
MGRRSTADVDARDKAIIPPPDPIHRTKNQAAAQEIKQAMKPKKGVERRNKSRSCGIAVAKKASSGLPRERSLPELGRRTALPKPAAQCRRLREDGRAGGRELGRGRNPRKEEGFQEGGEAQGGSSSTGGGVVVVALVGFGERGGGLVLAGEKHRGTRGARGGGGCFVIYRLVFLFTGLFEWRFKKVLSKRVCGPFILK